MGLKSGALGWQDIVGLLGGGERVVGVGGAEKGEEL